MKRLLLSTEKATVNTIMLQNPAFEKIITDIAREGGTTYMVGGTVRDCLLLQPLKDIDFEVHGIQEAVLYSILKKYGHVNAVGKSFGVLKFQSFDDKAVSDWSLPRTDKAGRKPEVTIDPYMDITQALRRRDLTINAMALNMNTYELCDPFNGEHDLKSRILRCPDPKLFIEDPLRFFRVMQFVGRFKAIVDPVLQELCVAMDLAHIARERIEEEIKKLLLLSERPSLGFRWLLSVGRMVFIFPELAALQGVVQSPQWHPEGDVFEHTMQALDAAAAIGSSFTSNKDRLTLMYAALCHDLGKVSTTVEHPDGKITSYGHEEAGVPFAQSLLKRFCGEHEIIATVKKLVRHHMDPGNFLKNGAKKPAYKRLALKLAPETNCFMLACLCDADKRGRNGTSQTPFTERTELYKQFLQIVKEADVEFAPEAPLIKGEDLLDEVAPGPQLGELVKKSYEMQIAEGITDKNELKHRILSDNSNRSTTKN